jgi:NAD(P)-dependent dehydrogenase (short-subunit alcohol dehydrogenase family)
VTQISFDGQVAVVTGAGNGLGRTYALDLARRGASVVVNDLGGSREGSGTSTAAQTVVHEILGEGGRAVANYDSVSTPEGGAAVIQTALEAFGTVDVVINNAGILRDKSFANMPQADIDAVLDVHLRGAFHVTQPAFRIMKQKSYGRLVFTSSNAGVFGNFGQANYGAAKAGLIGLSNVLAIEGAKYGIKSNVVLPVARTRMTEELLGSLADTLKPELITPLVVFLSSQACDVSQEVYSAVAGRYARVFTAVTKGWLAPQGRMPTAEDVLDQLVQIRDQSAFDQPSSSPDELGLLLPRLQARG